MSRRAFTLIELLTVILIMLVIAALAAAILPTLSSKNRVANAANGVHSWLLQAKMRAKRDRLATGIRLFVDPNTPGSVSSLQWIQQAESLTGVRAALQATPLGMGQWWVVQDDTNYDFTMGGLPQNQWSVHVGDYLALNDGGPMQILSVAPGAVGITMIVKQGNGQINLQKPIEPTNFWTIYRRPYPLLGEPPLSMPKNVVLDTNLSGAGGAGFGSVLTPSPTGTLTGTSYVAAYDILFSPSGQVVGQTGLLAIWVRDESKIFNRGQSLTPQIQAPGGTDDQALVGIRCTSGDVLVAEVNGQIGAGTPAYTPFYFLIHP